MFKTSFELHGRAMFAPGAFVAIFVTMVPALVSALLSALALTAPMAFAAADLGSPAPWLTTSGSTCTSGFGCTFIQESDDGTESYVAPSSGVITRYMLTTGSSFAGINAVGLRVFRSQAAGAWLLAAASSSDTELPPLAGTRAEISTRVPIQAGDHLGVSVEFDGDTAWKFATGSAADVVQTVIGAAPVIGATIAPAGLTAAPFTRLNLRAHLEDDADGDGYGDGSQDTCPLDPTRNTAPCTPPAITGIKLVPRRFRVNSKGAILRTTRAPRGSAVTFTLSQPASVTFVVSHRRVGRRSGGKCAPITDRNGDHKHCVYYEGGHHWSRTSLPAGANSLPYSGRYKHGHGSALLKPGRYRLTAVPGNAGGGTGPVAITGFTVVPR